MLRAAISTQRRVTRSVKEPQIRVSRFCFRKCPEAGEQIVERRPVIFPHTATNN